MFTVSLPRDPLPALGQFPSWVAPSVSQIGTHGGVPPDPWSLHVCPGVILSGFQISLEIPWTLQTSGGIVCVYGTVFSLADIVHQRVSPPIQTFAVSQCCSVSTRLARQLSSLTLRECPPSSLRASWSWFEGSSRWPCWQDTRPSMCEAGHG